MQSVEPILTHAVVLTPTLTPEKRPETTIVHPSSVKRGLRCVRPNTTTPIPSTQMITLMPSMHVHCPAESGSATPKADEVVEEIEGLRSKRSCTPPPSLGTTVAATTPKEERSLSPPPKIEHRPSNESPQHRGIATPARDDDSASPFRSLPAKIRIGKKEFLGRGQFGTVYRAVDLESGRTVAVKEIFLHMEQQDLRRQLQHLQREIRLMQSFDHPNIVKYLGARRIENELNIFMEYVPRGSIASILRLQGPLSGRQTSHYVEQILHGLMYLHERNVVHRDLKGENMLVGDGDILKLADFGTSRELNTQGARSVAGTAQFMAPEVITCVGHTHKADIWSLGCCCIEMLTGKPPFAGFDNQYAVMMRIAKGDTRDQIPPGISPAAQDFITLCLRANPAERPTAQELLLHPWLRQQNEPVSGAGGHSRSPDAMSPSEVAHTVTPPKIAKSNHGETNPSNHTSAISKRRALAQITSTRRQSNPNTDVKAPRQDRAQGCVVGVRGLLRR